MQGFDLSTISNCYIGGAQTSAIYLGATKIWPATQHDYSQDPLTFEVLEAGQFKFIYTSTNSSPMRYSLDNGTSYITMEDNTWTATIPAGSKMILDCYEPTPAQGVQTSTGLDYGIGSFRSTGRFNVSGNIGTILEGYLAVGLDPAASSSWPSLAYYQFFWLFSHCSHLISAEHLYLPTGTMTNWCYQGMFTSCTSLTTPPELPATRLGLACYQEMFSGCTSLTTAPELPATTLAGNCYAEMFSDCRSLTTAPELLATTLVDGCYWTMFYGCTNLNSVTCLATGINGYSGMTLEDCTSGWLQNVSATGTFTKAASMNDWSTGASGIPSGWTVQNYGQHDYSQDYFTIEVLSDGTGMGFNMHNNTLQYSTDNGSTWTTYTAQTTIGPFNTGTKVMLKQTGSAATSSAGLMIAPSENVNVSGNIMSLVYGDNFIGQTSLSGYNNAFRRMFFTNKVIDASNLILPATTLTNYCYHSMFYECTNLVNAPSILPATTLSTNCYQQMFYGCSNLLAAPEIPATTLATNCCTQMFYGCSSLTTAPDLLATKLVNYCYSQMFQNCTNLNSVKCLATNSLSNATTNWLNGASSTGTFTKAASKTWSRSVSAVPSGWTIVNAS